MRASRRAFAAGIDAVRAHGLDAKRVLLVGGAAFNPAVGVCAAQVFGLPIDIPKPGEYVAMGASVQAAWTLTGAPPLGDLKDELLAGHLTAADFGLQYDHIRTSGLAEVLGGPH